MIDLRSSTVPSDSALLRLLGINAGLAAVTVADELGVFSTLRRGERNARALAVELQLDEHGVDVLCRTLVVEQVLAVGATGFVLSEFGATYWTAESPLYWAPVLEYRRAEKPHIRLRDVLRTGAGINAITELWQSGNVDRETAVGFTRIMHSIALPPAIMAARSGAFDGVEHLLDVGGGSGAGCAAFVSYYPISTATLLDLPPVCAVGMDYVARYVPEGRVRALPHDFFRTPLPTGADAHLFANVLHDWPMDRVRFLLEQSFAALPAGGRLFVQEMLLGEDRMTPSNAVYLDLMMFINHGSQQFTFSQLSELICDVGFAPPTLVSRFGDHSLLMARR